MIKITGVSKKFKIPHEKRETVREHLFKLFKPTDFEEFQALHNVSFEVKNGEWLGIIGANGSGKSTLLKILAGVYLPDEGRVTIDGKLVPFLELGVGFNPDLSARDNIFLNGVILGMTEREVEKKFDEIVSFAEVEQFLDAKLKNFSSGMQVRLAFSIAIQVEADVYLLDEVLAVGDAAFQQKCRDVFAKMKRNKKSVILVSHSMDSINEYCDRALWINKGKVAEIGEAVEVTKKYIQSVG